MGIFERLTKTTWLRYFLIALGGVFILTFVFGAGFVAGRWSASRFSPFSTLGRNDSRGGHGAIGTIQSIQGQTITMQTRDGKLQTILVNDDTQFDKNFTKIPFGDLKVNDPILVIGSPNEKGEIKARLIGLVDASFRFPRSPFEVPIKSR